MRTLYACRVRVVQRWYGEAVGLDIVVEDAWCGGFECGRLSTEHEALLSAITRLIDLVTGAGANGLSMITLLKQCVN